jgi:hypothetical protein
MIDHIISVHCTQRGGATPSPPSLRTTKQPSTPFLVAAAGRTRPTTGAAARRPARGAAAGRPRPVQRRQRHLLLPHYIRQPGEKVQTRMPVGPGKRVGRRELNILGGGMIFLQDDESKQQFMADTGAVCSVLPHRSKTLPTGPQLFGADGRAIPCWGTVRRRLSFRLGTFFVNFLLAGVYRPILGVDFLSAHGLLVNPVGK